MGWKIGSQWAEKILGFMPQWIQDLTVKKIIAGCAPPIGAALFVWWTAGPLVGPIVWEKIVSPAIAAEAERALSDEMDAIREQIELNRLNIQEQIDKITASQSDVGDASRDAQAANIKFMDLVSESNVLVEKLICLQTASNPTDCELP